MLRLSDVRDVAIYHISIPINFSILVQLSPLVIILSREYSFFGSFHTIKLVCTINHFAALQLYHGSMMNYEAELIIRQ